MQHYLPHGHAGADTFATVAPERVDLSELGRPTPRRSRASRCTCNGSDASPESRGRSSGARLPPTVVQGLRRFRRTHRATPRQHLFFQCLQQVFEQILLMSSELVETCLQPNYVVPDEDAIGKRLCSTGGTRLCSTGFRHGGHHALERETLRLPQGAAVRKARKERHRLLV